MSREKKTFLCKNNWRIGRVTTTMHLSLSHHLPLSHTSKENPFTLPHKGERVVWIF